MVRGSGGEFWATLRSVPSDRGAVYTTLPVSTFPELALHVQTWPLLPLLAHSGEKHLRDTNKHFALVQNPSDTDQTSFQRKDWCKGYFDS